MNELQEWLLDLQSPAIALELAGLALCLALAWGLSWVFGRQYTGRASILFGRRLMDGVLLPALALGLTFALKLVLMQFQRVPLLKLVLPVLVSLVMIRLIARVLTAVFPTSRGARVLEQVVSWVAWGLAVLWFTGLWTPLMTELDGWQFMLGKTRISVTHVFEVVFTSGLVLVLALWLSATLEQRVLSRAFDDLSMRKVAANAIRVLLLVIGTLFALSSLGFDLTTLSVIGGALGVAKFAVDFDGDGRIDLRNSPVDAIGSVANYFKAFGWQTGMPTHYPVGFDEARLDKPTLLAPDILPSFSVSNFSAKGAVLDEQAQKHTGPLALVELFNGDEPPSYVAGTENFYVVTRYNWSSYYALAVIELGQEIKAAKQR